MECFKERKEFLYKYKDHLDFVFLTNNNSVTMQLIKETIELPWHIDDNMNRIPIPKGYFESQTARITVEDENQWNFLESIINPFWTWDLLAPSLDKHVADPRWQDRYGRWFFTNWCRNPAIMKISPCKLQDSIRKYIAATKIKRTFKRCVATPSHPFCKTRLLREFTLFPIACLELH